MHILPGLMFGAVSWGLGDGRARCRMGHLLAIQVILVLWRDRPLTSTGPALCLHPDGTFLCSVLLICDGCPNAQGCKGRGADDGQRYPENDLRDHVITPSYRR